MLGADSGLWPDIETQALCIQQRNLSPKVLAMW
jgi:hypothetical protein